MIGKFVFLLLALVAGTFAQTNQNCTSQIETCLSQWQNCESECFSELPTAAQSCFAEKNSTQVLEQAEVACLFKNGLTVAPKVTNQTENSDEHYDGQEHQQHWNQLKGNSSVLNSFVGCIENCSKQFVNKSAGWENEKSNEHHRNGHHSRGRKHVNQRREWERQNHDGHGSESIDRLRECAKSHGCLIDQKSEMNALYKCKNQMSGNGNSIQMNSHGSAKIDEIFRCLQEKLNITMGGRTIGRRLDRHWGRKN